MSRTIDALIENANDLILVIDNYDENMSLKNLKIWLPTFKNFLDGFDENVSIKEFKIYLNKILEPL